MLVTLWKFTWGLFDRRMESKSHTLMNKWRRGKCWLVFTNSTMKKWVLVATWLQHTRRRSNSCWIARQAWCWVSINDIARQLNLEIRGACIQLTANQGSDTNTNWMYLRFNVGALCSSTLCLDSLDVPFSRLPEVMLESLPVWNGKLKSMIAGAFAITLF